ncbi:uncharacterized protein G2W53_025324 [Senna tora]|uniref:Uncharacterized protein n=1 Tax=Senna tora TaxID=362788 RepID=A0A834TLZ0_9FABA|nr:uncharacterized protein G2W53_025324 [Senna tora]
MRIPRSCRWGHLDRYGHIVSLLMITLNHMPPIRRSLSPRL